MGVEPKKATDCNAIMRLRISGGVRCCIRPVIAVMNPVPPMPNGNANKHAIGKFGANGNNKHAHARVKLPMANRRMVITWYLAFETAPTTLPMLVTVSKMA